MTAVRSPILWSAILGRTDLLAFDFQRHLGLRLNEVIGTRTWREFADLVSGLLSLERLVQTRSGIISVPDTLTGAHFHRDEEDTDG